MLIMPVTTSLLIWNNNTTRGSLARRGGPLSEAYRSSPSEVRLVLSYFRTRQSRSLLISDDALAHMRVGHGPGVVSESQLASVRIDLNLWLEGAGTPRESTENP